MRAIFISYRRDDTEGQAGRLFDDLAREFGEDAVFMDVAGIAAGRDFRRAIDENVASCGVLLAMIGRSWLTVTDAEGRRRLDEPADFVRLEIASALRRDIPVVPVLVQGAKMPRSQDLPEDLRELAFRNGVELTHARWDSDVQVLGRALRPYVKTAAAAALPALPRLPAPPRRRWRPPEEAARSGSGRPSAPASPRWLWRATSGFRRLPPPSSAPRYRKMPPRKTATGRRQGRATSSEKPAPETQVRTEPVRPEPVRPEPGPAGPRRPRRWRPSPRRRRIPGIRRSLPPFPPKECSTRSTTTATSTGTTTTAATTAPSAGPAKKAPKSARLEFQTGFSGGDGVIYAVDQENELLWFRHLGLRYGNDSWAADAGQKVGDGWGSFKHVFAGGGGVIYAVDAKDDLLWYRHDGRDDGTYTWAPESGSRIGGGWGFRHLFGAGDGLIYAIDAEANLLWYRHEGWRSGAVEWTDGQPAPKWAPGGM